MEISILKFLRRQDGFLAVFKQMQARQRERSQVLVVPEKFGVSTERALFEYINGASYFMDVTTFDRLADKYVVDKQLQYLSKSAGVMLVQKIAQDISKELNVLSNSCTYNGFCENVFNTIMLLKSSQVTPAQLNDAIVGLKDISKLKLQDIQKIYEIYEKTLSERYIDSANKLDILNRELGFDDEINATDFYIYAPKLTKQVISVLATLIKCAHSVTIMLDDYVQDSSVYDTNYAQITALIKSLGAKFSENSIQRFDSLSVALKNVGSFNRFGNKDINFYSFKTQADEITAVCQDIINSGLRYKDSAVLVCNLDKYKTIIENTFNEFNIPYFLDTQQTLLDLAPTKMLLQMLNIAFEFKVDKVLNLVKSEFFDYDIQKVQNFELYTKCWGLNERNFMSPNKPEDEFYADFLVIYQDFLGIYKQFKEQVSKCHTYSDFINALRGFIEKYNIEQKILDECQRLIAIGQIKQAKLYEQISKKWNALFTQLENLLGLNTVSIKDFYAVLKAGLNSVNIKTPPLKLDCVYIGDAGNAMLYDYARVYAVGAVEGAFPVYNQDCGLILDSELDAMRPVASIDPTIRAVNVESVCNLLNNLVCCNRLWLSYPISIAFAEQKPSTFLNLLKKLFVDGGQERQFEQYLTYDITDSAEQFSRSIATLLRAKAYVLRNRTKPYLPKQVRARLNGIANILQLDKLVEKQDLIPRKAFRASVSQIQTYFDCPYKNFATYGLNIKDNPDNQIKSIDVGNFMHKVAELFGRYLVEHKLQFVEDESIFEEICNEALRALQYDVSSKRGKILDVKQRAILENLENSAKLMLKIINEQNKLSDFAITYVEHPIKFKVQCGQNEYEVQGVIDRVDTFENYVRIIDYKTGSETFREVDLRSGRRIQLMIYLGAIQKLQKLEPCGAFYFKVKDDFSSPYSKKKFMSIFKLNGVMVDSLPLIMAQDKSLSAEHLESDIIPIKLKPTKSGEFELNKQLNGAYSAQQVQDFIDYAFAIFRQGVREIELGNVAKSPYDGACRYCKYFGGLCMGEQNCRKLKSKKK